MAKIKKLILAAFILRLVLVFISGYHPDILNHLDWGIKLWQYGPKDFYEQIFWGFSWPNQPLGSVYLFGAVAKLYQIIFSSLFWLNAKISLFPSFIFPFLERKLHIILLKLPFITADLGLGWLIYQIVLKTTRKKKQALLGAGIFLFNPALIYNSSVWGQTDSLINLLALFGIWHLCRKNFFRGFLGVLLSFYFKLSLIIWLPAVAFILFADRDKWREMLKGFFVVSLGLTVISLPFVHHGNVFSWLWYLYTNRILPRQGEMLSGNAFNFWTLVYGLDLSLNQRTPFLGMTAKLFGEMVTVLLIVLSSLLFVRKKKRTKRDYFFLIVFYSFASFLFLTNMHERYLYPLFAPLAVLAAAGELSLFWFWGWSVIYLLNLYNLWWYPKIGFLKFLLEWNEFFLGRVLSLVLIFSFGWLLAWYYNRTDEN